MRGASRGQGPGAEPQADPFDAARLGSAAHGVLEALQRLDPDDLSPRQAHEQLRRLVDRLHGGA